MNELPPKPATTIYFGVHIPNDNSNGQSNVFVDKESALKAAKKHKKARFKPFQFYHEAVDFSINGAEFPNNNSVIDGAEGEKKELIGVGEKSSPFRTPRPQELTEFRGKIENGAFNLVREMINYNPRYLVSSGDTPSILQEGARLNAIHVAAKVKNAQITEYILNTVSNPEFIKRLYGDDSQENAEQRCRMLLDLYLNTPNKGFNDTPLHIASKWGADKVMEVLLSYPECDKTKRNKHNKLAEDVVCERADPKTPKDVCKRIQQMLDDNYYVPVLRTDDNTLPPLVGHPFSPTSPPLLNRDPLSPRMEIHAYAGPMDKTEADKFHRAWKTPPRTLNSPNLISLRLKDHEKGLERIGKQLANSYKVPWTEYWAFLKLYIDITSEEGLEALENHLKTKQQCLMLNDTAAIQEEETIVSPMTSLCEAFSACKIKDSSFFQDNCRPLVYVDKACHVFANRIIGNVSLILRCSEREYENTVKILETDIKLLELLINSYLDDERFSEWVNFQKVHSRLAHLIARKLFEEGEVVLQLEAVLESIVKKSDYFSSDDEGVNNCKNKPTTYRKQLVCLLTRIKLCFEQNTWEQEDDMWQLFNVCPCQFHPRKPKRNNISRSNSFKQKPTKKFDLQSVSRKLNFGEDILAGRLLGANGDVAFNLSSDSSKSDSDDEFCTPATSPNKSPEESDYEDAESPAFETFLEGNYPTKTDCEVFNAISYSDCDIDLKKYPLVYKWHHCISLYKKSERESWPNSNKILTGGDSLSPEAHIMSHKPSWLRITGANSPKAAIKSFSFH
ncbi:unnamed protein product [Ceutorhynchus assimilis]|uniref:ANKLE2 third alpha/beta domain-containing protein n=1 Tax=Ceutorhynchus assimilis TaxID=467358 RepID=A0A9N9MDW2_9CUCU|nr:unnamed protein product [Ceutorhynchus assimilis]